MSWFGKNKKSIKDIKLMVDCLYLHLAQLEEKRKTIDSTLFDVTEFLLLEIIDAYEAISTLYIKDHFKSCLILVRSVFEGTINLEYIYKSQDIKQTAKNYRLFSIREYLSRADKFDSKEIEKSELIATLRKEVEEYLPSGKSDWHWDGKSIKQKAMETDNEWAYDFFKQLSNYNHGKFRKNRDFSSRRPYLDFLHEIISPHSIFSTLSALQEIAVKFNLDGDVMMINDYPQAGSTVVFATNPEKMNEKI